MRLYLLLISISFGAAFVPGGAHADPMPSLMALPGAVTQGSTVALSLQLSNAVPSWAGANATLILPDGISLVGAEKGSTLGNFDVDFHQAFNGNEAAVILYSLVDNFGATSLDLANLTLYAAPNVEPGEYDITLVAEKCGISNADGSISVPFEVASGILTVNAAPPMPAASWAALAALLAVVAMAGACLVRRTTRQSADSA